MQGGSLKCGECAGIFFRKMVKALTLKSSNLPYSVQWLPQTWYYHRTQNPALVTAVRRTAQLATLNEKAKIKSAQLKNRRKKWKELSKARRIIWIAPLRWICSTVRNGQRKWYEPRHCHLCFDKSFDQKPPLAAISVIKDGGATSRSIMKGC